MFSIGHNIDRVIGYTARIHPQFQFAAALALTRIVKAVQADQPGQLERALDRPTEFTKRGTFVTPARKDGLVAVVGYKQKQSGYLLYQVEGGTRAPRNIALRLPATAQLDAYGNLPAGLIKQLIARAKAGKRATKRQSQRFGVSRELDLFYGDPGGGRPAGIYKRVVIGPHQHELVPIVVFPRRAATYRRRFDFHGLAMSKARAVGPDEIRRAWARAVKTAR